MGRKGERRDFRHARATKGDLGRHSEKKLNLNNMANKRTILEARNQPANTAPQIPTSENLDIDQAKIVSGFLGQLITAVVNIDGNGDGKISWIEILNKVQVIGLNALAIFPTINLRVALAQLKDADAQEREQLIAAFSEKFDLTNDAAEWLIEDWIFWLEEGFTLFKRTQAMLKPAETVVAG